MAFIFTKSVSSLARPSKQIRYVLGLALTLAVLSAAAALYYSNYELRNPNPQAYAWFGHAVAAVGDVNGDGRADFIVGAPYQQVGSYYAQGRAYVMSGRDGSILYTLDSTNGQENGNFGRAVAGLGDIDGDGVPDIIVGARGEWVDPAEDAGRVYLFSGRTGALIRVIDNPVPQIGNEFGMGVAGIGDIDGDAVPDLLVGAPNYHAPGQPTTYACPAGWGFPPATRCFQGRVYVFSGRLGTLVRAIEHPSPQEWSFFGNTLAGARDLDNDGGPDIVAAAPDQTTGNLPFAGEVYVINGRSGVLIRSLSSPTPQRDGMFGYALAVRDQNNDPSGPDILIGAPYESSAGQQYQGRAYLFRGRDGTLLRALDRPTPQISAHFGEAVADARDLDGDGVSDLLIGSPGEYMFNNPSPQGTAFAFNGVTGNLLQEFQQPNPQSTSSYGRALAGIGDGNRDGRPDIVVGAPYWTLNAANQIDGAAYLFSSRRPSFCERFPWACFCDWFPWFCSFF